MGIYLILWSSWILATCVIAEDYIDSEKLLPETNHILKNDQLTEEVMDARNIPIESDYDVKKRTMDSIKSGTSGEDVVLWDNPEKELSDRKRRHNHRNVARNADDNTEMKFRDDQDYLVDAKRYQNSNSMNFSPLDGHDDKTGEQQTLNFEQPHASFGRDSKPAKYLRDAEDDIFKPENTSEMEMSTTTGSVELFTVDLNNTKTFQEHKLKVLPNSASSENISADILQRKILLESRIHISNIKPLSALIVKPESIKSLNASMKAGTSILVVPEELYIDKLIESSFGNVTFTNTKLLSNNNAAVPSEISAKIAEVGKETTETIEELTEPSLGTTEATNETTETPKEVTAILNSEEAGETIVKINGITETARKLTKEPLFKTEAVNETTEVSNEALKKSTELPGESTEVPEVFTVAHKETTPSFRETIDIFPVPSRNETSRPLALLKPTTQMVVPGINSITNTRTSVYPLPQRPPIIPYPMLVTSTETLNKFKPFAPNVSQETTASSKIFNFGVAASSPEPLLVNSADTNDFFGTSGSITSNQTESGFSEMEQKEIEFNEIIKEKSKETIESQGKAKEKPKVGFKKRSRVTDLSSGIDSVKDGQKNSFIPLPKFPLKFKKIPDYENSESSRGESDIKDGFKKFGSFKEKPLPTIHPDFAVMKQDEVINPPKEIGGIGFNKNHEKLLDIPGYTNNGAYMNKLLERQQENIHQETDLSSGRAHKDSAIRKVNLLSGSKPNIDAILKSQSPSRVDGKPNKKSDLLLNSKESNTVTRYDQRIPERKDPGETLVNAASESWENDLKEAEAYTALKDKTRQNLRNIEKQEEIIKPVENGFVDDDEAREPDISNSVANIRKGNYDGRIGIVDTSMRKDGKLVQHSGPIPLEANAKRVEIEYDVRTDKPSGLRIKPVKSDYFNSGDIQLHNETANMVDGNSFVVKPSDYSKNEGAVFIQIWNNTAPKRRLIDEPESNVMHGGMTNSQMLNPREVSKAIQLDTKVSREQSRELDNYGSQTNGNQPWNVRPASWRTNSKKEPNKNPIQVEGVGLEDTINTFLKGVDNNAEYNNGAKSLFTPSPVNFKINDAEEIERVYQNTERYDGNFRGMPQGNRENDINIIPRKWNSNSKMANFDRLNIEGQKHINDGKLEVNKMLTNDVLEKTRDLPNEDYLTTTTNAQPTDGKFKRTDVQLNDGESGEYEKKLNDETLESNDAEVNGNELEINAAHLNNGGEEINKVNPHDFRQRSEHESEEKVDSQMDVLTDQSEETRSAKETLADEDTQLQVDNTEDEAVVKRLDGGPSVEFREENYADKKVFTTIPPPNDENKGFPLKTMESETFARKYSESSKPLSFLNLPDVIQNVKASDALDASIMDERQKSEGGNTLRKQDSMSDTGSLLSKDSQRYRKLQRWLRRAPIMSEMSLLSPTTKNPYVPENIASLNSTMLRKMKIAIPNSTIEFSNVSL